MRAVYVFLFVWSSSIAVTCRIVAADYDLIIRQSNHRDSSHSPLARALAPITAPTRTLFRQGRQQDAGERFDILDRKY